MRGRQADGRNELSRIALRLVGADGNQIAYYKFKVNPANYKEDHPQRSTVFKTRSATVVEDFGADLVQISFSGTTGFKRDANGSGADRLFRLKDLLETYAQSGHRIDEVGIPATELYFYNFTDGGSYVVHLDASGFSIERSAERPLLYDYTINLVVLRKANEPNARDVDDAVLGNQNYETTSEALNPNSNTSVFRSAMTGLRREVQ